MKIESSLMGFAFAARALDISSRAGAQSSACEDTKDLLPRKLGRSRFLRFLRASARRQGRLTTLTRAQEKACARFTGLRNDNSVASRRTKRRGCCAAAIAILLAFLATFAGPELRAQAGNKNVPTPDQQSPATDAPAEAQSTLDKSAITAYEGAMVHDVQFRGAKRSDQSELLNRLPVHSGHRFHRAQLKESLQVLYATGRFNNIQVEAETQPDKSINLYFIVDEAVFISAMHMYGAPRPPTANQLLNATKLRLGEEFTGEKLQIAIDRIKRVMAENGYFSSAVQTQTLSHPENQNLEINFVVTRGAHARVGEVIVEGDSGYTAEKIRGIAKLHPGDEVTVAHLTRALNRLRKKYQKQDRLEAQVSLIDRNYHPSTNRLDYTFKIDRGPRVDIRLEGARLRKSQIKKYVPVYEENAVDNDLLNEGQRNLRDYFQTQGYFDASIKFSQTRPQNDRRLVVYDI